MDFQMNDFVCYWFTKINQLKGLVHPKIKILSVFTHPHDVVPNLCVFISSAEHKGRYLEECFNQTDLIPHMVVNGEWDLFD